MKSGFNKHIIPRGRSAVRDYLKEHGEVVVSAFIGAYGLTYTGPVKPENPAGSSVLYRVRVKLVCAETRKARRLVLSGYRPVSNRYRILSRIDRADWREAMADHKTGGFPGDAQTNRDAGLKWVRGLGSGAADYFRRVLSADKIEVTPEVFAAVKAQLRAVGATHGWGRCDEFVPVNDDR
jgi:hypothetical protein